MFLNGAKHSDHLTNIPESYCKATGMFLGRIIVQKFLAGNPSGAPGE